MFKVKNRWDEVINVYGIIKETEEHEEYDSYHSKDYKYKENKIQFLIYDGDWYFVDAKDYEPAR
jgi:hypothetical protein